MRQFLGYFFVAIVYQTVLQWVAYKYHVSWLWLALIFAVAYGLTGRLILRKK